MSRSVGLAPGPLSRRFDAASVRDRSVMFDVRASPDELKALAEDCDLPGIDALAAEFQVSREGPGGLRVTGRVTARVRQICVVSLDEFAADVDEPVDVRFAPRSEVEAMMTERAARPTPEEDEADLPDPIVGGSIDLGALAAEILVLGLDPYPHKPGVVFSEPDDVPDGRETSPFSVLRSIKGIDGT